MLDPGSESQSLVRFCMVMSHLNSLGQTQLHGMRWPLLLCLLLFCKEGPGFGFLIP